MAVALAPRAAPVGLAAGRGSGELAPLLLRAPARATEASSDGQLASSWTLAAASTAGLLAGCQVSFTDSSNGVWSSRELNFEGKFKASTTPPRKLTFKDDKSVLTGTVRADGLLSGTVRQNGQDGGHFELQALPACYRSWWGQVEGQLKQPDSPADRAQSSIVIVSPGGRPGEGGGGRSDQSDDKDVPSTSILDAVMGRFFGQGGGPGDADSSPSQRAKRKEQLSAIADFRMRPDEVKAYLDKYVIKQNAAKEMLSVAICDHYNRAREELSTATRGAKRRAEKSSAGKAVKTERSSSLKENSLEQIWDITITKEGSLGADVKVDEEKACLEILKIEDGPISAHNAANPASAVKEGDVIIAANGKRGDPEAIAEELEASRGQVALTVRRTRVLPPPPPERPMAASKEPRKKLPEPPPAPPAEEQQDVLPMPPVPESAKTPLPKPPPVPERAGKDQEAAESARRGSEPAAGGAENEEGVTFTDKDGDLVELRLDGARIVEHLNGGLEIADVREFEIDKEDRSYKDDTGRGFFLDSEDLDKLSARWEALLAERERKQKEQTESSSKNFTKPNILLLGPTGSGKTYLLRNLAQLIGVPFVKADATKFTETGYVGRDSEDLMRDLLNAADGDVELAQVGIVYVDEIDKMSAEGGGGVASFRKGTQSTFLKLLEDTEVTVSRGGPQFMMDGGNTTVSTRHVLFVFSGAFSQLDKQLQEKHRQETSGFGFAREAKSADEKCAEGTSFLHKAGTEELVKAGLEPEFVGRIPVRVALGTLTEDDLFSILTDAKDGATSQLIDDFRRYGIELRFSDESLRAVAKQAFKEGTGARSLVTVLEGSLRRFKFHMPKLVPEGCTSLEVKAETIDKPEEELQKLLDLYPQAA